MLAFLACGFKIICLSMSWCTHLAVACVMDWHRQRWQLYYRKTNGSSTYIGTWFTATCILHSADSTWISTFLPTYGNTPITPRQYIRGPTVDVVRFHYILAFHLCIHSNCINMYDFPFANVLSTKAVYVLMQHIIYD